MKLLILIEEKNGATSLRLALDRVVCQQECTFKSLEGVCTALLSLKLVNEEAESITPQKQRLQVLVHHWAKSGDSTNWNSFCTGLL